MTPEKQDDLRKRLPYLSDKELESQMERVNAPTLQYVEAELTRRASAKAATAAAWAALAAGLTFAATSAQAIVAVLDYVSKH